jgi:peptidoglycan/LPS O-acetylase OafA/YrhL
MGLLRLLFALVVLITHSGMLFGYNIANSNIAITSFYIISGFYMALILDKKYTKKNSHFMFWSNRFLRIFPLYWITLIIIFLFTLLKFFLHIGSEDNAIVHYINNASSSNPFFFFANLFNYIVRNITLIITSDYFLPNDDSPGYLLVQQARTLQVELLFYVIAPCLAQLAKRKFILFVLGYSLIFYGIITPLHLLPYNLLFIFLSSLIYFLLGMGSYYFIYKKSVGKKLNIRLSITLFISLLLYLIFFNMFPFQKFLFTNSLNYVYYTLFIFAMPFTFLLTSSNFFDTFLGKLSYPVYITHFFIIKLLSNLPQFRATSNLKTFLAIVFTIIISFLVVKYIEEPIDIFRQKRLKKK